MRYYLSLVALLLASCLSETKDKQENTTNLVPADSLTVEVGMPTLIRCVGHQIFINNSFSRNYMIDAIDATNDSIMYSFAAKGQGDDEFLQIASMDVYHENNSQYLLLFDNMKRECITYHIDSLNRFKEFCKPGKKQKLPPTSRYLEVYKTNDFYIATGRTSKKYTLLEKDNLTRMRTYGDYLAGNDSDTDSMSISKANYGRQYIATGRDKMLSVVFMAGTISLYTIKSDSIQKTWDYTSSEFEYKKTTTTYISKAQLDIWQPTSIRTPSGGFIRVKRKKTVPILEQHFMYWIWKETC